MTEEEIFLATGFGSFVSTTRLIAVVGADSAPIRRLIQEARERGSLVDVTAGRKMKSVLLMDSDHVVISAVPAEKLLFASSSDKQAEDVEEE